MQTCRKSVSCRPLRFLGIGLVLGGGLLAGCGAPAPHSQKPTAQVTVVITFGGQPVTEGRVDLNNEQTGEAGGAELDREGVAKIAGVVLGSYTVTVVPPLAVVAPTATGQPGPAAKAYPNIPASVRMIKSSPLKVDVKKDSPNQFKFDLKDAAQPGR